MGQGMQDGFPRAEKVSDLTTPSVKAFLGRDAISLPHHLGVSCERGLSSGRQRHPGASVLRQHYMNGPQTRYQELACSIHYLEKLKHYFQAFSFTVLTEHP